MPPYDIRVIPPLAGSPDPTSVGVDVPAVYLPPETSFIHWSVPVRAYPGIDLDFKLTGYDWSNRALTWSLDIAPSGMTIDATTGVITWVPSSPGQDGNHSVTARLGIAGGADVTRSWTINVNTAAFVFVATTGNDTTGTGAIGAPYLTLEKAITSLSSAATIYMRGGTHSNQIINGIDNDPWVGVTKSQADFALIASYPGETATVDINFQTRRGLWFYQSWIVYDKITQINGGWDAAFNVYNNCAAKRCTSTGTDHPLNENPAGFVHWGGSLLDSCTAKDNFPTNANDAEWNCSDFMYMAKFGSTADAYAIDCVAGDYTLGGANTAVGFKVKRTDQAGPIHWHRCVAQNKYPWGAGIDWMSIRHCMGYSKDGAGFRGSMGSATANMRKGWLMDHTTMIYDDPTPNFADGTIYLPGHSYWHFADPGEGLRFQDCDIVSTANRASANTGGCVTYGELISGSAIDAREYNFIDCTFYSPSDSQLLQKGDSGIVYQNISAMNAEARNSGNTHATVPATLSKSIAGGTWTWDRDARTLTLNAPNYVPQYLFSAQGTPGAEFESLTPPMDMLISPGPGNGVVVSQTGPFGAATTGEMTAKAGQNFYGGRMPVTSVTITEGSHTWIRWANYFPSSFCAGYGTTPQPGFGATKWLRFGWIEGAAVNRLTVEMETFGNQSCNLGLMRLGFVADEMTGGDNTNFRWAVGSGSEPSQGPVEFPRDTWVFPQVHIYHHSDKAQGYIEMWDGNTYLGKPEDINNFPGRHTLRTIIPGQTSLATMYFGDYWNGSPFQDTAWLTDEVIWHHVEPGGDMPNTLDSGGRPFIPSTLSTADF